MNIFQTLNNQKSNFKPVNVFDLIKLTKNTNDLDMFWVDFENTEMYDMINNQKTIPSNSHGKVMLQYKCDGYSSQRLFCEFQNDFNNSVEFVHNYEDDGSDENISDLISLIEVHTQTKLVNEQSSTSFSSNQLN